MPDAEGVRVVWCEGCWAVQIEQPADLDFAPSFCEACQAEQEQHNDE